MVPYVGKPWKVTFGAGFLTFVVDFNGVYREGGLDSLTFRHLSRINNVAARLTLRLPVFRNRFRSGVDSQGRIP